MKYKDKSFKFLFRVIFTIFFLLTTVTYQEYRPLNGEGNKRDEPLAGVANTPFVRNIPSTPNYADENANLIHTPGNYTAKVSDAFTTCNAKLPDGVFPLPRCVSNKLMSMQSKDEDMLDLSRLNKFESKRKISHIVSVFLRVKLWRRMLLYCGTFFFLICTFFFNYNNSLNEKS